MAGLRLVNYQNARGRMITENALAALGTPGTGPDHLRNGVGYPFAKVRVIAPFSQRIDVASQISLGCLGRLGNDLRGQYLRDKKRVLRRRWGTGQRFFGIGVIGATELAGHKNKGQNNKSPQAESFHETILLPWRPEFRSN